MFVFKTIFKASDDMDGYVPVSRTRSFTSEVLLDKLVAESSDSSKFYVQTEEVSLGALRDLRKKMQLFEQFLNRVVDR